MRKLLCAALIASAIAAPAVAQKPVSLDSAVFVERLGHTNDGRVERRIEPASQLRRGDRLVMVVEWQTSPEGKAFAVTSPIPRSIAFQDTSTDAIQVSVDGGRNWGRLGALKTSDRYGNRLATPEDVTHLRWTVSPTDARRGIGRVTYSAIVR
ncbi:hypothetical protein SZ64_06440 [Erythrobacter sp. SG61-1L]|uniref:hypothetical protein n=1 Tax=Erythrobacter sp. SG61-1L TaxID=1603897 RepID=UPI0006C90CEC|nr:hypothetical protein [Erythrobacter sp. SG61-1L]KPL67784.1 hypothetical protein SZ64_06440 [Erythrobacter sp. SG61-1L]